MGSGTRSKTSAGGVVYRRRSGGRIEVVVGAQRDRLTGAATLRLPKGIVEPDEPPDQAALREVREEVGVEARVVAALGSSSYAYSEGDTRVSKRVIYFLMQYESGDPSPQDGEMQAARWCEIDAAARDLTFENERSAVALARTRLEAERP